MLPATLIGKPHRGSFICENWELRIAQRCLQDDLGASSTEPFKDLRRREIVKAFVRERSEKTVGTRDVNPLTCNQRVSVIGHQHHHRGATWFDGQRNVVWLLAYRRHRSGRRDDFFPFCKNLDARNALLPTPEDFKWLLDDQGRRFVDIVTLQAPVLLRQARETGKEVRGTLGEKYAGSVEVEIDADVEATTIAIRATTLATPEQLSVILAAFHPPPWDTAWDLPSRPLENGEVAFIHHHESPADHSV